MWRVCKSYHYLMEIKRLFMKNLRLKDINPTKTLWGWKMKVKDKFWKFGDKIQWQAMVSKKNYTQVLVFEICIGISQSFMIDQSIIFDYKRRLVHSIPQKSLNLLGWFLSISRLEESKPHNRISFDNSLLCREALRYEY